MTKAEMLRNVTTKTNEERANKRKAKHRKLAEKVIHTKLYKEAKRGTTRAEFVLKRGYSPSLIIEELAKNGFDASDSKMNNGKYLIVVKW